MGKLKRLSDDQLDRQVKNIKNKDPVDWDQEIQKEKKEKIMKKKFNSTIALTIVITLLVGVAIGAVATIKVQGYIDSKVNERTAQLTDLKAEK